MLTALKKKCLAPKLICSSTSRLISVATTQPDGIFAQPGRETALEHGFERVQLRFSV